MKGGGEEGVVKKLTTPQTLVLGSKMPNQMAIMLYAKITK